MGKKTKKTQSADLRKLKSQLILKKAEKKILKDFWESRVDKKEIDITENIEVLEFNEAWTEKLIEDNKNFEKKYINLYDKLYKRFQVEFSSIRSLESKCDFLQELMDDILDKNQKKTQYNISELAEESEKELNGLFAFFERKMNELFYFEKNIENDFPHIFKDWKAYALFLKFHEFYKDNETNLADYSFLYYAMFEDELVICKRIDFVRFLDNEFDIFINKIDSRQSGSNHRHNLYSTIRDKILIK